MFSFRELRFAIAVLSLVFVSRVHADPITSLGGTYGSDSAFSSSSVTFTNGVITAYSTTSGGPFTVGGPAGATVSDLTINGLQTFSPIFTSPTVIINMGNDATSPTLIIGGATFTLTDPVSLTSEEFLALSGQPTGGSTVFTTPVVLTSGSIAGVDLSNFLAGGQFTFTGNALFIQGGNPGTFTNPGNGAITGSFTLTADSALRVVPEPATLALFGAGAGLFGLYFARRRKQPEASVS